MFKLIIIASMLFASCASSANQPFDAKTAYCRDLGNEFRSVADFRNMGMSPQTVFGLVRDSFINKSTERSQSGITEKVIKTTVNLVFFNPDFANTGGLNFQLQVEDSCMRDGAPKYQPLN